jgi:hypothetical protein
MVPLSIPGEQLVSTITACGPLPDTFAPSAGTQHRLSRRGTTGGPCVARTRCTRQR